MENKIEGLVCDIQTVASDLCSYRQSKQFQSSPIRRVRSSTTPTRKSTVNVTKRDSCNIQSTSSSGVDISQEVHNYSTRSSVISSNPNITNTGKLMRERSSSASTSIKSSYRKKPQLGNNSITLGERSVSVDGSWNLSNSIPELPESPCLSSVPDYCSSSSALYSLHGTAPRKESFSSPTPPSRLRHTSMVTSTPNMSRCSEGEDNYYTLPVRPRVMSTSIPEDEVDYANDNLSQLSACTDEGSPNSVIIRRSSLTGQLEHFRKPRYYIKKMEIMETKSAAQCRAESNKRDTGFRVLNKGVRKSIKRSLRLDQVILPSVETTV